MQRPRRIIPIRDRVVQIPDAVIGIRRRKFGSFLDIQILDTLIGLEMELAVGHLPLCVDHLEGVRTVAVHVSVTIRYSPVAEHVHDLVCRLRHQRQEIPKHVRILQMSHRIPLLRVYEMREEDRVANEEDRGIVAD